MPPQQVNPSPPIQPEPVKSVSFFEHKVVWISVIVIILLGAGAYYSVYQQHPSQTASDNLQNDLQNNTSNLPTSADVNVGVGYFYNNGKIFYYYGSTNGPTPADWTAHSSEVVDADLSTFVMLKNPRPSNEWESGAYEAVDSKNFYAGGEMVPLSGPDALVLNLQTLNKIAEGVFKDDHAVYTINIVAAYDASKNANVNEAEVTMVQGGADPATFVALADPKYGSSSTYAKDKNAVYFLSGGYNPDVAVTKIPGIDPNTFKIVGICSYPAQPSGPYAHGYNAVDATHVLADSNIVPSADPSTFKIVGEIPATCDGLGCNATVYAVDKTHVYRNCSEIVKGATPVQCTADLKKCEN